VINIGLELLFIVVFKWGIAGASFATLLAQFISACLCLVFIYRHFPLLQVSKADFKISKAEISEHLKMGLPMGFQSSIIALGQVILQLMLNTLGSTSVAAYTAAARIDGLATMPAMSFGITMATFAAQNLGAREFARIRSGVKQTLAVSLTFSTVTGILIIIFGHSLVNLFVGNGQPLVTNTAQTYFYFNSSLYWLLSILFVVRYTLQGLGQSLVPTLAGIMELIMRAFAGLVLINAFGFAGASMANPLAWLGSLLVLISSYVRTMRHLRTLETAPNEQFVK
jgi:Na+-driven multidrug efflux pump